MWLFRLFLYNGILFDILVLNIHARQEEVVRRVFVILNDDCLSHFWLLFLFSGGRIEPVVESLTFCTLPIDVNGVRLADRGVPRGRIRPA